MKILRNATLVLVALLSINQAMAFCGFYVAKADANLMNKTSQVIIVRDGNQQTVTMSNDFKGDVKDFAMVIPVPEVLKRENIRLVDRSVFEKLNGYSSPRLVEYHDYDPCALQEITLLNTISSFAQPRFQKNKYQGEDKLDVTGITVEAKYAVGNYDIVILSTDESEQGGGTTANHQQTDPDCADTELTTSKSYEGLKKWLTLHEYKIPESAFEVLDPYIKSNMKFFVVKVNLDKTKRRGFTELKPLQIEFASDKFMLPIRLGMVNGHGAQDMLVYAFTKTGRVEVANYRTFNMPSDFNVPEFVEPKFNNFYESLFKNNWSKNGENAVFLEYAWDLTGYGPQRPTVKCDPCPPKTAVPDYDLFSEAGVNWIQPHGKNNYSGPLHFTRLRVRYSRDKFPQDLQFIETPNKQRFQARYVMQKALKELSCDGEQAKQYYQQVMNRRQAEVEKLAEMTGWDATKFESYVLAYQDKMNNSQGWIENDFTNGSSLLLIPKGPGNNGPGSGGWMLLLGAGLLALGTLIWKVHSAKWRVQFG